MMISRAQAWRVRLALSALAVIVAGGLAGVAQNTADPIRFA